MYRGNFSGGFPPSFQPSIPHPRQRFPGGWEGKFVGRPVDGEEIITRPIIKEEELNHMDDIARDSSWARPDEIDYKFVEFFITSLTEPFLFYLFSETNLIYKKKLTLQSQNLLK